MHRFRPSASRRPRFGSGWRTGPSLTSPSRRATSAGSRSARDWRPTSERRRWSAAADASSSAVAGNERLRPMPSSSTCKEAATCHRLRFQKYISFILNFLFRNSHGKFDRQIIVSNQINQIESWQKCRCSAWVRSVCHHRGSNSWPRVWCRLSMFRAKCDTTQLSRRPSDVHI